MIIRHKHKGRFTVVPNAIFSDERISLTAKGLLGYLLSLPGNWDVRQSQLQYKLDVGRKTLSRLLNELEQAGYLQRDQQQGRDEYNRFTTLNYVIRDIPDQIAADALDALHLEPQRQRDTGNNKEEIKTESNKPFPKPLSTEQVEVKKACQDKFSDVGQRALANGQHPVYVGSKPHQAWLAVRGPDGMPGFVDRAIIGGKLREILWMPSVFPPQYSVKKVADDEEWGP